MCLSLRSTPALFASLVTLATLATGCRRDERPDLTPQLEQLKAELEKTQSKLREAETNASTTNDKVLLLSSALETGKIELAEKDQVVAQRDLQIRSVQAELDALKKRDVFVFAEIRSLQQQGSTVVARGRYQQFLRDYPNSIFAEDAARAVSELAASSQSDFQSSAELFDTGRHERQMLDLFRDGLLTPDELAPILKRKTRNQVMSLLGRPNLIFPEGTEIGYNDKATNPVTGKKGMLIITFDSNSVSALRVDYAGRKIVP